MTVKVGVIGCGNISSIYFKNGKAFEILDIVACADLDMDKAKARAEEFDVPKVCGVEELLADPQIGIVANLTTPDAHASVALRAIEAGKSVYNEKPLAIDKEDGRRLLEKAKSRGVLVGSAPDTFMGGGIQTCIKLIDEGAIGEVVGATTFMMIHGHESWHPNPDFYYQPGGGPMFDMGPYYLTALIALIGPLKRVTGASKITFTQRTITSKPRCGEKIPVNTPTHITGIMEFVNGALATIVTSFDVWAAQVPTIEIYGTRGSLSVPSPNGFEGPVRLWTTEKREWTDVPLTHGYTQGSRGIGIADMAYSLGSGRRHRANGEMAYHVLDVMHAFLEAPEQGRHVLLESSCERPAPLPTGLAEGVLDD